MLKKALFLFAGLICFNAHAALTVDQPLVKVSGEHMAVAPANWNVGDKADYKMSIGSFLKGTMSMSVKAFEGSELVINQKLDLQIMQQDCDITINISTGETKSMVCNGENQDPGEQDLEIIEQRSEEVTVPAGTFPSTYVKALEKNQNVEIEQWVNPYEVPVMGLIKMISQTQMGEMVAEMTSFEYAN